MASTAEPTTNRSYSFGTPHSEKTFLNDLLASLVVMLVAVPLALGIALASGAPSLLSGLIACVVGGVIAGLVAGAPLQVSGPAAGLTVIVYTFVQKFGWETTCAITLFAGLMQVLFGLMRVGRICLAISSSVVHGMLAGIGLVIILAQLHVVLGGAPESSALKNLMELPNQLLDLHGVATGLGIATIVLMAGWGYTPRVLQKIPRALVAVLITTVISVVFQLDAPRVVLPNDLLSSFSLPQLPDMGRIGDFFIAALTMAIVASVESLLCAVATDKLHTGKRASLDRELVGQGCSNFVSGFIGGLPVTGVIVRSSANVAAGAKTNRSSILHGLWILLFIVFFSRFLELIPLASLAGLLVYVGASLLNLRQMREMIHAKQAVIFFSTLLAVSFWNLLGGVTIGVVLSLFFLVLKLAKTEICVEVAEGKWHIRIEGTLTFISIPELSQALSSIPQGALVEIDLMVDFIDHAALETLHAWRASHEKGGGKIDIDELHEDWKQSAHEAWNPIVVHRYGRKALTRLSNLAPQTPVRPILEFFRGVSRFHESSSAWKAPLFSKLAREGQNPKILFIGCSDSRVIPHLITATKPGEMFTMQNIGNLIPSYPDPSVGATLDYALQVLKVEHVMICGHSDCGAMKVLSGVGNSPSENVSKWLEFARPTSDLMSRVQAGEQIFALDRTLPLEDQFAQVNVLRQLQALKEYPSVVQRLQEGGVNLWGLFFNIGQAQLSLFDESTQRFIGVGAMLAEYEERPGEELVADPV